MRESSNSPAMSKVLILDGNSAAGLECTQSLGRNGAKVHVASPGDAVAFHSKYCSVQHVQPAHPNDIVQWVEVLDAQHRFDLIIPSTERSLMAFANTACSEELYRKAVIPDRETLRCATNKETMLQLASALGLPVPASVLVTSSTVDGVTVDFPVAVKPVQSKAISGKTMLDLRVAYAKDTEELRVIVSVVPNLPFQVQTLVRGYGVGIELLFVHGEPVLHFAHERVHEWPLTGGGSCYRKAIKAPPALLESSIRLLKELQWHGVAMVEWKVDAVAGPMLMEVNPRLWGSLALAIDAGVDFPRALLDAAADLPLQPQPKYRVPYYTRDITRDLDWLLANLKAPRDNPQLLVRPRMASFLELFRPLLFVESWDFFDFRDVGITVRRLRSYMGQKITTAKKKVVKRYRTRQFVHGPHRQLIARMERERDQYRRILFLCYGNICRSPLAALLMAEALPEYTIRSAGFHEKVDRCSPPHMLKAASKARIDMAAHRSRKVTADEIEAADLVIVMDWKNYHQLLQFFPQAAHKATFLGLFSRRGQLEIDDPYELHGARLDAVVENIVTAVEGLKTRLGPSERAPSAM